jgi:DNA-binding Lrp family transcriptional regulator
MFRQRGDFRNERRAGRSGPENPVGTAGGRGAVAGRNRPEGGVFEDPGVLIRTSEHEAEWQRKFLKALRERPEVLEAHRLAGDIDYILKVRVKNARAYDTFYQALISEVRIYNVTALLSMEEIKSTTVLPL